MNATDDPVEKEANTFAANLLVPTKFLANYIDIATIKQLATVFMVSPEVIRNRINTEFSRHGY